MSILSDITLLLEFCLKNIIFCSKVSRSNKQSLGHPVSPIVSNFFMAEFETKVINTAANPPRVWRRYVGDTFLMQVDITWDSIFTTYQLH